MARAPRARAEATHNNYHHIVPMAAARQGIDAGGADRVRCKRSREARRPQAMARAATNVLLTTITRSSEGP